MNRKNAVIVTQQPEMVRIEPSIVRNVTELQLSGP